VLSHLLARLLFLKASLAGANVKSQEALLASLQQVRRSTLARSTGAKHKLRVTTQLEEIDASIESILPKLGIQS